MNIRNQIWYFFIDSKTNENLSNLLLKRYQKLDLCINILLVLTTSSSVAAWAIWQKFPLLWALLIGISQILTLIKPYFLFHKYIKVFSEKGIQWQYNTLELEKLWYDYNNGIIDDNKASSIYFELRKKCISFDNMPDDIIFFNFNKIQVKAEKQCNCTIEKFIDYGQRKINT